MGGKINSSKFFAIVFQWEITYVALYLPTYSPNPRGKGLYSKWKIVCSFRIQGTALVIREQKHFYKVASLVSVSITFQNTLSDISLTSKLSTMINFRFHKQIFFSSTPSPDMEYDTAYEINFQFFQSTKLLLGGWVICARK